MEPFTLKLVDYGADVDVALERFANDEGLYEKCFYMLLDDPNFVSLGTNIEAKDYEEAFKSAHALKGVVGNLELTPMYKAVSEITEALRTGEYNDLDAMYARVQEEFVKMQALKD